MDYAAPVRGAAKPGPTAKIGIPSQDFSYGFVRVRLSEPKLHTFISIYKVKSRESKAKLDHSSGGEFYNFTQ